MTQSAFFWLLLALGVLGAAAAAYSVFADGQAQKFGNFFSKVLLLAAVVVGFLLIASGTCRAQQSASPPVPCGGTRLLFDHAWDSEIITDPVLKKTMKEIIVEDAQGTKQFKRNDRSIAREIGKPLRQGATAGKFPRADGAHMVVASLITVGNDNAVLKEIALGQFSTEKGIAIIKVPYKESLEMVVRLVYPGQPANPPLSDKTGKHETRFHPGEWGGGCVSNAHFAVR